MTFFTYACQILRGRTPAKPPTPKYTVGVVDITMNNTGYCCQQNFTDVNSDKILYQYRNCSLPTSSHNSPKTAVYMVQWEWIQIIIEFKFDVINNMAAPTVRTQCHSTYCHSYWVKYVGLGIISLSHRTFLFRPWQNTKIIFISQNDFRYIFRYILKQKVFSSCCWYWKEINFCNLAIKWQPTITKNMYGQYQAQRLCAFCLHFSNSTNFGTETYAKNFVEITLIMLTRAHA